MDHTVLAPQSARSKDLETLLELNRNYIRSAAESDVRWYAENLAEDYLASNPDGSLANRAEFLARIGRPSSSSNLESVGAQVRFFGDLALIHSGFRCTKADGRTGSGRYTDIYALREGRWLCVSAHFNFF